MSDDVRATVDAFDHLRAVAEEARGFGYVRQPDGTERYGHVPHVAPEAWFHVLFAPLTENEVGLLEVDLDTELPPQFRRWLQLSNGLNMFSRRLVLYGLRADYSRNPDVWLPFHIKNAQVEERPPDAERSFVFIGSSDWWTPELAWRGSSLYVDALDGSLHLSRRHDTRPVESWPSFAEGIVDLCDRLAACFDDEGRLAVANLSEIGREQFGDH